MGDEDKFIKPLLKEKNSTQKKKTGKCKDI